MKLELFPFFTAQLVESGLSRQQSGPLGLVSALGSHLENNQDVIMGRVPDELKSHLFLVHFSV